jgi:hypothetical protein
MKKHDRTAWLCVIAVLIGVNVSLRTLAPKIPIAPRPLFIECWLMPYLPWCTPPDPPNLPKPPKPEPVPAPVEPEEPAL